MIASSLPVSRSRPSASPGRAAGIAAYFVLAEGVAASTAEVAAATGAPTVAQGRAPYFAHPALPADQPVLEQFDVDIAIAPEIVGELLALYVEQYRHLAIAFVARALKMQRDAAVQIEVAARRREAGGLAELAALIYAALDLVLPPLPAELPPVILDLDSSEFWPLPDLAPPDHEPEAWAEPGVTPPEYLRP